MRFAFLRTLGCCVSAFLVQRTGFAPGSRGPFPPFLSDSLCLCLSLCKNGEMSSLSQLVSSAVLISAALSCGFAGKRRAPCTLCMCASMPVHAHTCVGGRLWDALSAC